MGLDRPRPRLLACLVVGIEPRRAHAPDVRSQCGEEGHIARDCPDAPPEEPRACYNVSAAVWGGRWPAHCVCEGGGAHLHPPTHPLAHARCLGCAAQCGQEGHLSRDCPNPKVEGAGPRRARGGGDDEANMKWGKGEDEEVRWGGENPAAMPVVGQPVGLCHPARRLQVQVRVQLRC